MADLRAAWFGLLPLVALSQPACFQCKDIDCGYVAAVFEFPDVEESALDVAGTITWGELEVSFECSNGPGGCPHTSNDPEGAPVGDPPDVDWVIALRPEGLHIQALRWYTDEEFRMTLEFTGEYHELTFMPEVDTYEIGGPGAAPGQSCGT
ncbi:MAG: hypothetical protein AAFU79_29275, partial [Myxococcota bacterium]